MLAKLSILILLPAGVDADTAKQLVGRWESEPIKARADKTMTVVFRVNHDELTEKELADAFKSFGTIMVADHVDAKKGYMVAGVLRAYTDIGPGKPERCVIGFAQSKGDRPLRLTFDKDPDVYFAAVKADARPPAERPAAPGEFEYLRATSRQLREGTIPGLKYEGVDGRQIDRIRGVLNYLGGEGWDAVFQNETLVCKRKVGDRTRWEYFVAKTTLGPEKIDLMDQLLRDAGKEGWELSAVHEKEDLIIFKRPLPAIKDAVPKKDEFKKDGPTPAEYPTKPVIK